MFNVMLECVLSWERESFGPGFSDPGLLKNRSIVVKTIQCILDLLQCCLGDCRVPDKVAEVQKRGHGMHHIARHIAFDRWEPYLFLVIRDGTCSMRANRIPS